MHLNQTYVKYSHLKKTNNSNNFILYTKILKQMPLGIFVIEKIRVISSGRHHVLSETCSCREEFSSPAVVHMWSCFLVCGLTVTDREKAILCAEICGLLCSSSPFTVILKTRICRLLLPPQWRHNNYTSLM